jgi:hypothetical protein
MTLSLLLAERGADALKSSHLAGEWSSKGLEARLDILRRIYQSTGGVL